MSKATKLFRPDIQVMRGIAVLSVVLFHFRENIFSTGYLGVDVFFVISGFVVTPLLVRIFENQSSRRSILRKLLGFYRRRFYRLAPAMGATLVLSAILIFLLGNVNDLERFSKQGLATLLLIGNFGAYEYSGEYFSPNPNPLVHMWSLSLEEQIYIGMPLILFFALKRIKVGEEARRVSNVFLFLLITSSLFFAFPQLLEPLWTSLDVSNSSAMNFYSPFTRV
jgi:peptidoglycan/LPS O-acetylase OafA/YrhL